MRFKPVSDILFIGTLLTIFLISASGLYAQNNITNLKSKPTELKPVTQTIQKPVKQTNPKPTVAPITQKVRKALPDLIIKTLSWSSLPKVGDTVGMASSLSIGIQNQSSGDAGDSKIKISCQTLSGSSCPSALNGTIDVQPLDHGQTMNYACPYASPATKWGIGKYKITVSADFANQVQETSETNNSRQLTFSVRPKLHMQHSAIQAQTGPSVVSVLSNLQVQSPVTGSEHETGKPLSIK